MGLLGMHERTYSVMVSELRVNSLQQAPAASTLGNVPNSKVD